MGYMHIENLYKNQDIFMFKRCYAMEKIHGTSAHISYKDGNINFFAGGSKHETFVKLFDVEMLLMALKETTSDERSIHIYGEAYGGSIQRGWTTESYGNQICFVAFEVKIGDTWLSVPKAEHFCKRLGLDFVHYLEIPTMLEYIDAERDADSIQAIKNGMGEGHKREGIVLRPLEEVIKNNGERVIAKHKRADCSETTTPRNITDKLIRQTDIKKIVDEWVTEERLNHIVTSGEVELKLENIGKMMHIMISDIYREGKDEIEESKDLERAIGRETALLVKRQIKNEFYISQER